MVWKISKNAFPGKPDAILRTLGALSGPLLTAALSVLILLLVHRRVYAYLMHNEEFQVDVRHLAVLHRPEWAGTEMDKVLVEVAEADARLSIFDVDLAEKVNRLFERNPWVARVEEVRKAFPNRVEVKLLLRRPALAIERKGQFMLVDAEGVRLPGLYSRIPRLPFGVYPVLGAREENPAPGQRFDASEIRSSLAIAAQLDVSGMGKFLRSPVIDVTNFGGRRNPVESEIVLWTPERVALEWGRAPEEEYFGELPAEEKIRNLKLVLQSSPGLRGLSVVRLQYHRPYVATR